ncbi:MAG: hypothetical protein JWO06_776 [Bacteroidota bacterium]|nr:hypothetical protein [Bacteroidota bacterium]
MKQFLLCLLIAFSLSGCNFPTTLPISDSEKPADNFARHFFDNLIKAQTDSCFAAMPPESQTNSNMGLIVGASKDLAGCTIKKSVVVENKATYLLSSGPKTAGYSLSYEYYLDKDGKSRIILFQTRIKQKEGAFYMTGFSGGYLTTSLEESSEFSLKSKAPFQYAFLSLIVVVMVFMLISLFFVLFGKMSAKKKITWTLIILFVNLPRFLIDWNTGHLGFHILAISLMGVGFMKTALYSAWTLYFSFPLGAVIFWFMKRSLLENENISPGPTTEKRLVGEPEAHGSIPNS